MNRNLIHWTEDFSVGDDIMDTHHKHLISLINELYVAYSAGNEPVSLMSLLDKMIHYSIFHLDSEEKFMKEIDYPYIEDHKKLHKDYKLKIMEFRNKIKRGVEDIHEQIFSFLKKWWSDHILEEDMRYFDFLR